MRTTEIIHDLSNPRPWLVLDQEGNRFGNGKEPRGAKGSLISEPKTQLAPISTST
jgi:hypothetical protein